MVQRRRPPVIARSSPGRRPPPGPAGGGAWGAVYLRVGGSYQKDVRQSSLSTTSQNGETQ